MANLNKSKLARGTGSRKHRPRTVNFIKLWDKILSAYLLRNDSHYGETRTSNSYVDLLGFYSGEDNITYMYSIDGYPKELENSYRTTLRGICKQGVRLSFISQLEKHTIDWGSAQMKARMRTWRALENENGVVDEYNLYDNLNMLDAQGWRKDSLVYLSTAEIRRKRKMFKFRSVMFISGIRGKDFNDSVKELVSLCKALDIKISRIIGDIPEYLKVFSPFSNTYDNKVLNQCGCTTIPDELLARFNTYAQGIVGKEGIYWGTDIYSHFPCLKVVKRTPESAENILITAETGGGKSYLVKCLTSQLSAKPEFNGTIMDLEGFEYLPLANYMSHHDNVVILNIGEGTGAYYDPVEVIMTGDEDLDADMYSLSTSFTLALFKCLLGNTQFQDEWVDIVINDAVSLTYGRVGVDASDPSTWRYSKGLTLGDVYQTLKGLRTKGGDSERAITAMHSTSMWEEKQGISKALSVNDVNRLISSNDGYQKAIDMCVAKISRYFEPNGIMAHLFRNRINIDDIKDAKLVVCSFGMAGRSENTVDPIQMALMQLYASSVSHLRSIFSKRAGKFNFKLWEEFQRWGGFPDSEKVINVALTGGRKLGDVNIILTNRVGEMLKNDRFGVFSNITSIAVGAIGDADIRRELCDRLSIPHMLPELDKLAVNNKDLGAYVDGDTLFSNIYSKAFLLGLDRTVYTLARVSLPKELRESSLFSTGVKVDDSSEQVKEGVV